MKHLLMLVFFLLPVAARGARAQERVTTASGRVVLLYPDGTWKYADAAKPAANSSAAAAAGPEHKRPAASVARVELAHGKASVYYDPKVWREIPSDEPGRMRLVHEDGDGYAIFISERIEMTMDALRDIALTNAKSAAPDARITSEEQRRVNGRDVTVMQIDGTIKTIQFTYLGYYYVGPEGTFQLITYTSQNLFKEYKPQFEQLLDGFTINP